MDVRTLQRRLAGGGSRIWRTTPKKALSDGQELAICDYIRMLDQAEQPARFPMVRGAANYLLREAHLDAFTPPPPIVSNSLTKLFLNRNPQFFKRKQKPLAAERKHAHNAKDIREYFEAYRAAREARGIVDEDVWNMDETGFRIGCGRAHWVVSGHSRKPLLLTDPDNREYVTSCECISAGGRDIPLMVIIAGVLILEKWAQQNDLNDDVLLTPSPTGYSNDDLAIDWLKHFDKHSRKGQVGAWRMLIMDGYGSHMTYEFFTYAKRNQSELFRLPPHSTHLTQPLDVVCFQPLDVVCFQPLDVVCFQPLDVVCFQPLDVVCFQPLDVVCFQPLDVVCFQPLDVVCFQPFKHYHFEGIDELVRFGGADFDKLDFLSIFQRMRNQTFTSATILSSFRYTGLVCLTIPMWYWRPFRPEDLLPRPHLRQPHCSPERPVRLKRWLNTVCVPV